MNYYTTNEKYRAILAQVEEQAIENDEDLLDLYT